MPRACTASTLCGPSVCGLGGAFRGQPVRRAARPGLSAALSRVSPPHACSCVASPTCEESVSGSCAVLCFRDLPSAPLAAPPLTSIRPQAHARRTLSPVRSLPNLTELWVFTAPTSPPPTPTVAPSAPNRVHPFWRTATGFHGPSPVLIKTSEVLSRRTEGLGW